MTLQQAEKPSVDMVAQLSEVFDEDRESGTKVLIHQDASVEELVSQINVWTLVSSKFTVNPGRLDQQAAELLEQMAEAGAFPRTESDGFFYPEPDDAMQCLTNKGLVVPSEIHNQFLISEKGASFFTAMTTVGSCVSLEDFQQRLGLTYSHSFGSIF